MKGKQIHVNMANLHVAKSPDELTCIGLGSCIGIILYDAFCKVGGLAHVLLPNSRGKKISTHPGKFADTALPELVKKMRLKGAQKEQIQAMVFGGANMFPQRVNHERAIGKLNADAVFMALKATDIPVLGVDIGGHCGRSVYFNLSNGEVLLKISKEAKEKKYLFKVIHSG